MVHKSINPSYLSRRFLKVLSVMGQLMKVWYFPHTVNSEFFARVLFSRNFASFVKIKSSPKGEITLSFTYESKSCHSREFLLRKHVF